MPPAPSVPIEARQYTGFSRPSSRLCGQNPTISDSSRGSANNRPRSGLNLGAS